VPVKVTFVQRGNEQIRNNSGVRSSLFSYFKNRKT
jgi:hypothetical protein